MKTNRVIALMIGLLLTFSMTACGEQMSAMNTDMEEKTEEKSAMDEKMEESSDMNMMEGKTEEQLLAVENDILFANNALWEKVFMSMDKNVNDDMLSSNYGDVLMSAVEGAKDQFSAEEYEALKADAEKIREIDGVGVELTSGKEHRFVLKLTHPKLSDRLGDADPQVEGEKVRYAEPLEQDEHTLFTARIVKSFMERVREVLKDSHPANGVLLRGFTLPPRIPSMADLFQLRPAAIANYPMYRGLAKLVGMTVLPTGPEVEDEMATLRREWDRYDYFFIHVKKTDSYGEDGNFENKKSVIEKVDCLIPEILSLKPDVFAITGDHSTPCRMKGHSWHPNPFLLFSPYVFAGACQRFTERECAKGILGTFPSVDILPFLMANALKLKKYGA